MSIAAFAAILAFFSSAPAPVAAPVAAAAPQEDRPLSAPCRAGLTNDWDPLVRERDNAAAVRRVEAIEAACAQDRGALGMLMSYHAELDLKAGRYTEGVARIEHAPLRESDSIWPVSRWTYMALLEMTGDADTFRQVRDQFVAAHDRALQSHPRHHMRKVERFETPAAFVDAYEGEAMQDSFLRLAVFVATPKNGGMPVTLSLTRSLGVEALISPDHAAFFFDLYPCDMHANLGMPEGTAEKPPTYAVARAKAMEVFSDPEGFAPFAKREHSRFCGFESYMMPGFDSPEVEEEN